LSVSEGQEDLAQKAAQVLDQLWWGLDCQCNEEQALEIHRLALLGKEEDIATKVYAFLSSFYNSRGQFRQADSLYQNTLSIIANKQYKMVTLLNQGNAYQGLGLYQEAINSYQDAKLLAEVLKNEEIEGVVIGNLGICYYSMGQIEESIRYYVKALQTASTLNNEELQGLNHNYLGCSYSTLGDIEQARYHYQQALAIAEKIKNLLIEVMSCCNLCDFYGKIGESQSAITYGQRALKTLETTKDLEDLESKATILHGLAEVLIDEERYHEAIFYTEQSIEIAKQVDSPKLYSENYSACACAYLYSNKLNEAWNAATEAKKYDYPQNNYYVLMLLGLIALKQGNHKLADDQFQATLKNLEKLTSERQSSFRAWDTKFLALCGLALSRNIDHQNYISDAVEAYQKARLLSQSNGTVKRVRQLFQILKSVDSENRLNTLQTLIKPTY
jgi:tetratricopeptide (TPR) repeat protein